jgi:hypothetical protein
MADHLDSTNLVPFKKRRHSGYHLPGMVKEEEPMDEVDPELRPEEQMYVRHYLAYADILLKNVREVGDEPSLEEKAAADQERSRLNATGLFNRNGWKNRAA